MAGDGVREGQEISRRIREELERIREAEGRVEEALETVRQARRRVEVVARELSREEERVRAWVREELLATGSPAGARPPEASAPETAARTWRSEPPAGWAVGRDAAATARDVAATPPAATPRPTEAMPGDRAGRPAATEADAWVVQPLDAGAATAAPAPLLGPTVVLPHDRSGWGRRAGLGVAALLAIALVGWFAIRGLDRQSAATIAADTAAFASPNPAVVAAEPAAAAPEPATPSGPLAVLPAEPASRQALYDSLFAARSPVFEPLLAAVGTETSARAVQRAIAAWKEGQVDAQDADLIHSALLQHVLKETDPRIEVDGQVLRNPCRGRSCSALLNVWENQQAKYGLAPVPDNAPTDARALRQAEAVLVLGWARDANANAAAPATP